MSKKTTDTTSQTTGSVYSNRRPRYRNTVFSSRLSDLSSTLRLVCHFAGLQLLDPHFSDAVAFHIFYDEPMALVIKGVAGAGNFLQPSQNKTGQSLKAAITGQCQIVLRFEVAYARRSLKQQPSIPFERHWLFRRKVELVLDFTHQLLQNIFHCDNACSGTKFVNHNSQMSFAI